MIRLLTAAAVAALLATPVLAQSSAPPSGSSTDQTQMQGSPEAGSSMQPSPGAQSQVPSDCLPNDPRPECQTAQLPSDQSTRGGLSSPGYGTGSTSPDSQPSPDPNAPSSAPPSSPSGTSP